MAQQNGINNLAFGAPGYCNISGYKFINANINNASVANHDLYTVPTGKRCLFNQFIANNFTGSSISFQNEIKVSGTYYNMAIAVSGISFTNVGGIFLPILEAGESLAVNAATNAGLNFWAKGIEFDNTINLKSAKILNLSNGDNTLYTVPLTAKGAIIIDAYGGFRSDLQFVIFNESGVNPSIKINLVTNGGSPATTNQCSATTTRNTNTRSNNTIPVTLGPGDFVNVNTSSGTSGQRVWINVLEYY